MTDSQLNSVYGEPVVFFNDGNSCFVIENDRVVGLSYLRMDKAVVPRSWHPSPFINNEALEVLQKLPPL